MFYVGKATKIFIFIVAVLVVLEESPFFTQNVESVEAEGEGFSLKP